MSRIGLLAAVLALLVGACGDADRPADDAPATPVADGEPAADGDAAEPAVRAVATLAPLADLVAQVGGDRVAVTSLVPPGVDSHTYEPSPTDVADLEAADVYFGNGLSLNEGALALAEATLDDGAPVVRLGEAALDEDDLVRSRATAAGGDAHGHGDEGHTHDGDEGHTHAVNPHTWLSVPLADAKVAVIAEALAELDPDGAEVYRDNAAAYRARLAALHHAIAEAAATVPEAQRTIVTFHDAYGYFADEYGFELVGAVQPSDAAEPTAADVAALIDRIRAADVPAVFGSAVFADDVSEQVAAETGATYTGGLSDDVLPGEPGDPEHSYLGLMAHNARVIVDGLGGDASGIVVPRG